MAVTKVINSESKQYKPVLVDSLVLDAAPTVGSLNGVTSDGVAKAISGSGSVPTPAAGDDGKVLTANDGSFGWAEPTGGDSYTAGTGITISEENAIAVTEAISNGAAAGATAVQPAALNDYALSSSLATVATTGSYNDLSNKPTIPTVDQNYNAASTNAQSGVAVAQAIAAIPSASYTAGDGIDITANAVSVKAGTGLEIDDVSETVQQNLTCSGIYEWQSAYHAWDICPLTQDIYDAMNTTGGFTLTLSKELGAGINGFYLALATPIDEYRSYSHSSGYAILGNKINASAGTTVSYGFPAGTSFTFKLSDYNSSKSNRTLEQVAESISSYHVVVILDAWDEFMASDVRLAGNNPEVIATCEATTTITDALCVSNPLPASTSADENKVLTVNASGNAEWATPATPSVDEVPDVTSTDDGKVLTASYSGGQGSYSWQTAQGGGGASYTATAPIAIESDVIKLKYDGNFTTDYQFDVSAITGYEQTNIYGMCSALTFPTLSPYYAGGKFCLIFDTKVIPNYYYVSISGEGMSSSTGWTIIAYKQGSETTDYVYATEVYDYDAAASSSSNKVIVGHGQDVKYYTFRFNQNNVHGDLSHTPLCFAIVPNPADSISGSSPWGTPYFQARGGSLSGYLTQVVKTNTNPSAQNVPTGTGTIVADTLTLSSDVRTLPSYTSLDSGKVLKVNSSGNVEWANMSLGTVQSIQQVNDLPANPNANTLYLIPEA